MDPFYVAFAVIRLLVYLTFLIKTKLSLRHWYLWLFGLSTFVNDASYILISIRQANCCETAAAVSGAQLIKDKAVVHKWLLALGYLSMLDERDSASQLMIHARNYYGKPLVISIAYTAITAFTSEKEPDKLFEDESFTAFMFAVSALYFLFLAWKSDAGKQASFLAFGCIFTLLPLSSMFNFFARSLMDSFQLLSSSPLALKIQYVILFGVAKAESITVICMLGDTMKKKLIWPNFKDVVRVPDVGNAVADSFDDKEKVNNDRDIKASS